jgi:aspartate/glutamate racemase
MLVDLNQLWCQANTSHHGFLANTCYTPYLMYNNPQIADNNHAVLGICPPSVNVHVDSALALWHGGADNVVFACTTAYDMWQDGVSLQAGVLVLDLLELVTQKIVNDGHQ